MCCVINQCLGQDLKLSCSDFEVRVPTAVAVHSRNMMCVQSEGLVLPHNYDSVFSRWFYLFEHLNELQCHFSKVLKS